MAWDFGWNLLLRDRNAQSNSKSANVNTFTAYKVNFLPISIPFSQGWKPEPNTEISTGIGTGQKPESRKFATNHLFHAIPKTRTIRNLLFRVRTSRCNEKYRFLTSNLALYRYSYVAEPKPKRSGIVKTREEPNRNLKSQPWFFVTKKIKKIDSYSFYLGVRLSLQVKKLILRMSVTIKVTAIGWISIFYYRQR